MKLALKKGAQNVSVYVFIQDSSKTTGEGLTGLVYNTTGLKCYYVRPRSNPVQLSLVTQTVTGAFSAGGFKEIDSTNLPGVYRLDLHNNILASGVDSALVMLHGADGMAPCPLEIQLTDFDLNNNAVVTNVATLEGRLTAGRAGYLDKLNVAGVLANTNNASSFMANVASLALEATAQSIKAKTDNLPASPAAVGSLMGLADGAITANKIASNAITDAKIATDAIAGAKIKADAVTKIQNGLAKTTDLSGLAEKTDIPSDYAKASDLSGLAKTTDITALNNLSAAEMLNEVVVGTFTLREILTILAAKSDGYPATGGGTTTITYGGIDGTPGVIVETVDEDGNRSKVEFNL